MRYCNKGVPITKMIKLGGKKNGLKIGVHNSLTRHLGAIPTWALPKERWKKLPKRDAKEQKSRIPSIPWDHNMEFKRPTKIEVLMRQFELTRRVGAKIRSEMLSPRNKIGLSISFTGVMMLGMLESSLMIKPDVLGTFQQLTLMAQYSTYNLIPSMIWDTIPLDQVARACGYEPEIICRSFDLESLEGKRAASVLATRTRLLCDIRSIIASFMTLTQIIRMIQIGLRAFEWHQDSIINGREPPLHTGVAERFFRLGGTNSDVTELSMERYPNSMIPIYGGAQFKEREALWLNSKNGKIPAYWQIRKSRYASIREWLPMFREKENGVWYLKTKAGKSILYIEADATNVEEALALGKPASDLSISQASQAFRVLEMVANTQITQPPDHIVRVFLADTKQRVELGGDNKIDLGRYVWQTKEADIIIDATAPLLHQVLEWCERVQTSLEAEDYDVRGASIIDESSSSSTSSLSSSSWFTSLAPYLPAASEGAAEGGAGEGGEGEDDKVKRAKKTILFDTSNKDYYHIIGVLLSRHGYRVLDRGSVDPRKSYHFPRLIYRETSADTVSLFHALMTRRLAEPSKCCILIDSTSVRQELEYIVRTYQASSAPMGTPTSDLPEKPKILRTASIVEAEGEADNGSSLTGSTLSSSSSSDGSPFTTICSAEIYDDLFRQVRIWTRMGYKPVEIQRELSARFHPLYEIQDDLKEEAEESEEKDPNKQLRKQREATTDHDAAAEKSNAVQEHNDDGPSDGKQASTDEEPRRDDRAA